MLHEINVAEFSRNLSPLLNKIWENGEEIIIKNSRDGEKKWVVRAYSREERRLASFMKMREISARVAPRMKDIDIKASIEEGRI